MIDQHVGWPTTLYVFIQAFVNEVLKRRGPPVWDARRLFLLQYVLKNSSLLLLIIIWRFTFRELNGKNTKWPHINFFIVRLFYLNSLWCDPAGRTNHGVSALPLSCQNGGLGEATEFYFTRGFNKNVVRLDTSVYDVFLVQLYESLQCPVQSVLAEVLRVAIRIIYSSFHRFKHGYDIAADHLFQKNP